MFAHASLMLYNLYDNDIMLQLAGTLLEAIGCSLPWVNGTLPSSFQYCSVSLLTLYNRSIFTLHFYKIENALCIQISSYITGLGCCWLLLQFHSHECIQCIYSSFFFFLKHEHAPPYAFSFSMLKLLFLYENDAQLNDFDESHTVLQWNCL